MSEEFDRDALFNDIDKIMAEQGYTNIKPMTDPVEIRPSDILSNLKANIPDDMADDNIEIIKPSVETTAYGEVISREEDVAPVKEDVGHTADNSSVMEDVRPSVETIPIRENINTTAEDVHLSEDIDRPAENISDGKALNASEESASYNEEASASPMFTTIEKPIDWPSDKNTGAGAKRTKDNSDQPPVSYLEGAANSGYTVENVAFGDVSVGVETESVEYSVGHPLLRLLRNILICVAAALLISLLVTKFIAHHTSVDGSSMKNTLSDGDQLIVEQFTYYFHEPERFDVVVFPISTEDNYIKRIIGLPGETVQIIDGQVYINGKLLTDDRYGTELMNDPGIASDTIYLQKDEYFVLGDNRNASVDSRFPEVGLVKGKDIKGKAWLRFYPFGDFGIVR